MMWGVQIYDVGGSDICWGGGLRYMMWGVQIYDVGG